MFIGSDLIASGGGGGCSTIDGAVRVEDGSGRILAVNKSGAKITSQTKDAQGNQTTECVEPYSLTVQSEPVYQVTFDQRPTITSSACDVQGTYTATANAAPGGITKMPTISYFFSCL